MTEFAQVKPDESPAVTSLGRLIARLALDEDLYEKFDKNPAPVIAAAGLSAEERQAIESEDWQAIKRCICPGPKPVGDEDTGGGPGGGSS